MGAHGEDFVGKNIKSGEKFSSLFAPSDCNNNGGASPAGPAYSRTDGVRRRMQASSTAAVGQALIEGRKEKPCSTYPTYFLFCMLSALPIFGAVGSVGLAKSALKPWIADVKWEGFQKVYAYAHHTDGGWKSKLVENQRSASHKIGGPKVYTTVFSFVSIFLSATLAGILLNDPLDSAFWWVAAATGGLFTAMLWAMMALMVCVWVDPGSLPFR